MVKPPRQLATPKEDRSKKTPTLEEKICGLEELAMELLKTARQFPPSAKRHDLFKEIGRLRVQIIRLKISGSPKN
jgi:hypothetical protein